MLKIACTPVHCPGWQHMWADEAQGLAGGLPTSLGNSPTTGADLGLALTKGLSYSGRLIVTDLVVRSPPAEAPKKGTSTDADALHGGLHGRTQSI